MNYTQTVDYIFSFSSLNAKPSLERIKKILSYIENPQNTFKSVHIAGTNGKGSVCTYISSVLTKSGYRTGLFTSPHIVSFCERIKVNGEMISEKDVVRIVETLVPFVETMDEKPTAFDLITAVAFKYFSEKGCDFAVLECGLGGKFDSTNVVTPILSVLCSISLDHLGILGNDVSEITNEKCGIIKQGVPIVCYPFKKSSDVFNPMSEESQKIIEKVSEIRQSELIISNPDSITSSDCKLSGTTITVDGLTITSHLSGVHQKANMLTAYTALKTLSKECKISDESIISGFANSSIEARLERLSEDPTVIVDGGHNADCAKALRLFIESSLKGEKLTAVIAMMRDKQCDVVLSQVAELFDMIIVTDVASQRSCSTSELAQKAKAFNKNVICEENVSTAIKKAIDIGNTVLIFGSFYLAGKAKEYFSS